MQNKIVIFDTTLRDGEQSPGASLTPEEKVKIAKQLAVLGVDIIEAGFPVSSPGDFSAVKLVAQNVKGPVICGLARCTRKDIETCASAIKGAKRSRIHIFIATSDIHMKYKLKKTPEEVLEIAKESVKYARRFTDNVEFSAEDAGRTEFHYLCKVVEVAIGSGATTINIPDTVGYTVPEEFSKLIKNLINSVPNMDKAVLSVHCHNDLGLAVANSLAAVVSGARQIECTINGIGERAGNASLEEIVMTLKTRRKFFNLTYGINTKEIYKTSRLVSSLTSIPVQPNKAIVGSNAFAHEAGIHQDGVLKSKLTYEIMTPQSVGIPRSTLVLGKHSGRHALHKRLIDIGYRLRKNELDTMFQNFKNLADKKKYIFDEDIIALVEEKIEKIPECCSVDYYHISSGSGIIPVATVRLRLSKDKKIKVAQEAANGDGPVDAAYNAIDSLLIKEKVITSRPKLVDYKLHSISVGRDAQGEVITKVDYEGMSFTGRGTSTDIIEASIKSYLNAINRIVYNKNRGRQRRPPL
ncbi:MAG: 2-isopropylmalate synthase [Elusimicrobia bacterium CG1_02_37_114]|nr:MAG: 2-isopropylmalate synthase [Elusimicrobia bacterium CG1_02_37_114]PIV52909.1 MAG: 2-isopropylmalate synthase [Elusimicrobia bacterium CG02_land_8_20_14_3_00_37_13]PIZ13257.1 MAG: 2-isopropylmalate synthase [Elusimicrobia bacterium CG_4_10_14_0_8_um_filter_37_32]